ncbi:MAG TPA: DUF3667 domain-containing protein [Pseudomonadales bacterium]
MEQPSHCLNCGEPLQGPYCHACGQPVKGMVRHLRSFVQDFLDTVLEYDSRIWRTLLPLYFRPGHITLEFLAGRRMRFVSPFRLFFVLTVAAFLVLQFVVDPQSEQITDAVASIQQAESVPQVEAIRERALAELARSSEELAGNPDTAVAAAALAEARARIEEAARTQIDWLQKAEAGRLAGRPVAPPTPRIRIDGEIWDPETNPVAIGWLPDLVNEQINVWIGRAAENIEQAQQNPRRLVDSFLGLLPAALFVLMPLFALLLKLFYIGKRWLYTAHLVVALHSHSFLGMAMIIGVLLGSLADVTGNVAPWAAVPARGLALAAQLWIPLYLLFMQRRVYAQSWPVTLVKFGLIGTVYGTILAAAVSVVALISLVVA